MQERRHSTFRFIRTMLGLQSLLLSGIAGYFIGSIPSAYLITKWKTGMDLRREGSKNIGARNAFEVTGNKSVGWVVLVMDLLKGFFPVLVCEIAGCSDVLAVLIPALVLGHCYPVWLKFHGGRGLATMAGSLILVNPIAIVFWLLVYVIANRLSKHVHFAIIMACGAALLLVLVLPINVLEQTILAISGLNHAGRQFQISVGVALLIILSRHIEPFLELVKGKAPS
jgi:acyl phosphate:glycerol-3-phosphate acyltransferase